MRGVNTINRPRFFSIDGRDLSDMTIINYRIIPVQLHGDGSGRINSFGHPLILDPQGTVKNVKLEFAPHSNTDSNYVWLCDRCDKGGHISFAVVSIVDNCGRRLTQNMQLVLGEQTIKRVVYGGVIHNKGFELSCIAERGLRYS